MNRIQSLASLAALSIRIIWVTTYHTHRNGPWAHFEAHPKQRETESVHDSRYEHDRLRSWHSCCLAADECSTWPLELEAEDCSIFVSSTTELNRHSLVQSHFVYRVLSKTARYSAANTHLGYDIIRSIQEGCQCVGRSGSRTYMPMWRHVAMVSQTAYSTTPAVREYNFSANKSLTQSIAVFLILKNATRLTNSIAGRRRYVTT